jgi:hypothetical protein
MSCERTENDRVFFRRAKRFSEKRARPFAAIPFDEWLDVRSSQHFRHRRPARGFVYRKNRDATIEEEAAIGPAIDYFPLALPDGMANLPSCLYGLEAS